MYRVLKKYVAYSSKESGKLLIIWAFDKIADLSVI